MPPGKTRRKDDTWTTEDLTQALQGSRGDGEKKKRSRDDEDKKERRKHKDEVNGDEGRRRHKDDEKKHKRDEEGHRSKGRSRGDFSPDDERRVELTEEDRERMRQERRDKRGGDSKKKEDRPRKDEKPVDSDEDTKRRHKRDDSARKHRKRDDEEDGDRRRRHGDDDGDRKRHKDKESRHRDRDRDADEQELEDERERRRQERRERRDRREEEGGKDRERRSKHDDDEKKERHKDREERRKDREERHRDKEEKHRDKGEDREERKKRDKGKDKEDREEREERKRREREKEKEEQRKREEEERRRREEEEKAAADDEENDYADDDFEDYEDDFEDDDELNEHGGSRRKEGELEEVLRALDEENARLTSLSNRSNWSDSTELSDERFKEGEETSGHRGEEDKPVRPRTFINFVSAKQRVMNNTLASKARRRADDLKSMIELDTVYYDLFDLPPVREYDLYIRSFGRTDTKQAYVQTNEDAVERDVQTEEVEDLDKWTQHPAEDLAGVGGDGITAKTEEKSEVNSAESMAKVGKFVEKAAQVVIILLDEEKGGGDDGGSQTREKTSNVSFSEGLTQLGCPSYLTGRHVEKVSFCPMQPNMFLTLHSQPAQPNPESMMDSYGLIGVWNVKDMSSPQKVLTCLSQPTCACFSPSRAALVIAGMHDGSVMLWDLREPSSLHHDLHIDGQEVTTRFPTYNTAGVLEKENHHSPVLSITAVHPTVVRTETDSNDVTESEGLSFQLASVEENAIVNLWVVTEIPLPDMAGSEVDLGLAPGGRVKLLRSSAIVLDNPNKLISSAKSRALDIQLNPSDLNHFFVSTDLGQIIHGVRFGSRVFPRVYQSEIDSPRKITCLDFSPFGEPYFLAGCEDGSLYLYHTSLKHPLATWPTFSEGHSVISVQWSRSRPVVFFVLTENSTIYTFDLVETGLGPVKSDPIPSGRATALAVSNDPALIGGLKTLSTHMLVALDNGSTELHTVSAALRQQQPLEREFLAHYMERF